RHASPHAGGLSRQPRAPMRVLHTGDGDGCCRPSERDPQSDGAPGARGTGRKPLPLHRLSQHRQGRARCGPATRRFDLVAGTVLGTRMLRKEDAELLTGEARFVDDLSVPGALHVALVRSPHAHARIRSINTAAAKAMDGVVAVYTGPELREQ